MKQKAWSGFINMMIAFLLLYCGMNLWITGYPLPMWYREYLEEPVQVSEVTHQFLLLTDGRKISLPFINLIPDESPQFNAALKEGVEINEQGDVSGLVWHPAKCALEKYRGYRKRVNLSELAATIYPEGINSDLVDEKLLKDFQEHGPYINSPHSSAGTFTSYGISNLRYARFLFEDSEYLRQQALE